MYFVQKGQSDSELAIKQDLWQYDMSFNRFRIK